jgi:hypothetical protein
VKSVIVGLRSSVVAKQKAKNEKESSKGKLFPHYQLILIGMLANRILFVCDPHSNQIE